MNYLLDPTHNEYENVTIPVKRDIPAWMIRSNPKDYPRIIDMSFDVCRNRMVGIINKAFMLKGQAIDSRNVHWMANELTETLFEDAEEIGCGYISFEEIEKVVKRDILAEEQMGINVSSLYKILRNYIKGEGHEADKEAKRFLKEAKRNEVKEIMATAYAGQMLNK